MDISKIVLREVNEYAGEALNGHSYLMRDTAGERLSILDIGVFNGQRVTGVSLVVLISGDKVIIEQDRNDKPLVDALVQAGIPRSQIILAYNGEPVPEGV
jgi:sulfur carrier protein ThiS